MFVIKHNLDSCIDGYKTRLVAKGFTQTYGVDYAETFSLIARLNSIRVLLLVSLNQDWEIHQLDGKNAFLYGDLFEQVLMEQHNGYIAQGKNTVCRPKKAIYSLK